jgi:hypothetical protein
VIARRVALAQTEEKKAIFYKRDRGIFRKITPEGPEGS